MTTQPPAFMPDAEKMPCTRELHDFIEAAGIKAGSTLEWPMDKMISLDIEAIQNKNVQLVPSNLFPHRTYRDIILISPTSVISNEWEAIDEEIRSEIIEEWVDIIVEEGTE